MRRRGIFLWPAGLVRTVSYGGSPDRGREREPHRVLQFAHEQLWRERRKDDDVPGRKLFPNRRAAEEHHQRREQREVRGHRMNRTNGPSLDDVVNDAGGGGWNGRERGE